LTRLPPGSQKEIVVETIHGATVISPAPGGAVGEANRGPVVFGPEQSGDAYVAWVGAMPAGDPGPPLHLHPHTDEGFYVAEGEMTFQLGDREVVAPAGSFVFVPRGVVHTAWNSGAGPMRGMLILSPGGAEHVVQSVAID
jgi:mannose-6-phosphate isomerase-like protein (cupin superfamily)